MRRFVLLVLVALTSRAAAGAENAQPYKVDEDAQFVRLETADLAAAICKKGYVCMIEEFGGRPIQAGQSFSAAFIVGYFDTLEEMHRVYDAHKGFTALEATEQSWKLTRQRQQ
jgi:hypothetical protein